MDISKFDECNVLVVGDLIIDEYVWGEAERISPEAPVQVVSVNAEDYTLGGAGNVAHNLFSLGAKVSAVGVIGGGRNGKLLLEKFTDLNINTEGIVREAERPTTRKTRIIAANQHVLRIDRETRKEISDQTFKALADYLEAKIPLADVILISDYGKGLIIPALLNKLIKAAKEQDKITIADPKGRDFAKYAGVSMLTPNLKEAARSVGIETITQSTPFEAGTRLLEAVEIENLLITCGKDGMVLFEKGRAPFVIPAKARQIYDVSGAGDTVLAVLGLAVASGESFKEAATIANTAAGIVVGKIGTATVSQKELSAALKPYSDAAVFKHKNLSELADVVSELKQQGKKIVLTNGCFDLLHAGHIKLFSVSKQMGDALIVAIDDDASVRKLKGAGRPVLRSDERVQILSALDSIDYVVVFSTEKLNKLIETTRPDILAKGSNYTANEVFGREVVEKYGGRVALIPVNEEISSTRIIDNIKSSDST
ncbi:D-glycero-beta-D-manno-heptose-7-phosphate kinase [Thermodesulfobacteriota bacterium]